MRAKPDKFCRNREVALDLIRQPYLFIGMNIPPSRAPGDSLGFLLVTATRLLRLRLERAFAAAHLHVTPGEARALAMAGQVGAVCQADLAAYLSIEPMTLVGYLDRLETSGLIQRVPDPKDGRSKQVRLTAQAQPVLAEVRQVIDAESQAALRDFAPEEAAMLHGCLRRLCQNLGHEPALAERSGER